MIRVLAHGRRRLLWTSLALSAVLAALPVSDRLAAAAAEKRLAERIAGRQSAVVGTPRVSIDAFPFLLSAAEGTFSRVTVRADAVTGEGQPVQASVELRGVAEKAGAYTAATADARFTVPFGSFGSFGGGLGEGASLSADADGRLRIRREVLGLPLTVVAELRLAGRTVTAVPVAASFAGRPVDPAGPRIAGAFAGRERAVPELPAGLVPTGVSAGDAGVTLHARAEGVRLA
ncbi:LmeA family phospholipid-binding protein [Streptomyces sp. NPDC001514]